MPILITTNIKPVEKAPPLQPPSDSPKPDKQKSLPEFSIWDLELSDLRISMQNASTE
jgi:hypothetical protein